MLLKGNPKEEKGRAPRVWPRGSGVREGGVPLRPPPRPAAGAPRSCPALQGEAEPRVEEGSKGSCVPGWKKREESGLRGKAKEEKWA